MECLKITSQGITKTTEPISMPHPFLDQRKSGKFEFGIFVPPLGFKPEIKLNLEVKIPGNKIHGVLTVLCSNF